MQVICIMIRTMWTMNVVTSNFLIVLTNSDLMIKMVH